MVVFGKVTHSIFDSEDGTFHIFNIRRHGGQPLVAVYRGENPPKAMKTIEYEFHGEEVKHPKYGTQLEVHSYCRSHAKGESKVGNRRLRKLEQDAANHMRNL